jgi:protein tyrosine/serine phosphatase
LKKIYVLSQFSFDEIAKENDLDDDNVELFKDTAFISIVNANGYDGDMQNRYDSDDLHWFKKNHDNVLNLEFDDVESDVALDGTNQYTAFSEEQAREVVEFIDKNKNKTFLIHCLAGISRSGAVGRFLYDYYPWVDREWFDVNVKRRIQPNQRVYNELKKVYGYENKK